MVFYLSPILPGVGYVVDPLYFFLWDLICEAGCLAVFERDFFLVWVLYCSCSCALGGSGGLGACSGFFRAILFASLRLVFFSYWVIHGSSVLDLIYVVSCRAGSVSMDIVYFVVRFLLLGLL